MQKLHRSHRHATLKPRPDDAPDAPIESEQVFLKAAMALSSAKRESVFADLVRSLAELVEADIALVGVHDPCARAPSKLRTLAAYADGKLVPNFEYDLAGTPCERVIGKEFCYFDESLQEQFPETRGHDIHAYAAIPLIGTDGMSLGLLAVMTHTTLARPERVESMLRIFSERVIVEIERARTETALRASEELYRSMFNASMDGLALLTPEGLVVDVNPALLRQTGYAREELIGRTTLDFMPQQHHDKGMEFLRRIIEEGFAQAENKSYRKDGSHFYSEPRGVLVQYREEPHVLLVVRDITERKLADRARAALEAQLRQAGRMEALGQLTGGIAHDFNNILTGVLGYIDLANEHAEHYQDPQLERYLDRALRSGGRARDLIQQMLTFSRGQRGDPQPLDLARRSRETISLLESTLPATIQIVTRIPKSVPIALLDPIHFEQILVNLCINGRDAMNGAGTLTIALAERECAQCFCCASCRHPASGSFIELAIGDTGAGIAPEVLERMFEPFFSTKDVGKGSGMGLAIVHGIVHEYGGHIVVDSKPGCGTTVRVLLPSQPGSSAAGLDNAAAADRPRAAAALAGRIGVVDDNPAVGEFLQDLLERWGLTVTLFQDAAGAREYFTAHADEFDLVILDQTMPQVTGVELAGVLHGIRPGLPIVLYTGYTDAVPSEAIQAAGIRALVRKPLEIPVLRRLLETELGSS